MKAPGQNGGALALGLAALVGTGPPGAGAAATNAPAWRLTSTAVGAFNAVSCANRYFCLAVGWTTGTDYYVTFDGHAWGQARKAEQYKGEVESVSCPAEGWCMAITDLAAVSVFAHGHWSKLTTIDPNPGPPYPGMAAAVDCTSPRYCAVVDAQGNAETFDGRSWSKPELVDVDYPLNAVSCASPGDCAAVDGHGQVSLLSGGQWSAPQPIDGTALTGVSCASPNYCVAVDLLGRALVDRDGRWSAPVAIDQRGAGPLSVSCPTVGTCVVVDADGDEVTLGAGRWGAPMALDAQDGLVSISCTTGPPFFCAAVDGSNGVLWNVGATAGPSRA